MLNSISSIIIPLHFTKKLDMGIPLKFLKANGEEDKLQLNE
jgi:hypothetical protein